MPESTPARFSIISAVYNVGRYLPEFIDSIDKQNYDLARVEVIMVDDGSSDTSAEILEAWRARQPDLVRIIRQENAGQGSARNNGLRAATGEWVTFTDPDDVLAPGYLRAAEEFLTAHPETTMVAANRLMWNEETGAIAARHPLRRFFSSTRLVDIEDCGTHFHGGANSAFLRRDVLAEHGIEFDVRIRPNFEDGHFCSLYLLHFERPTIGFVKGAEYHYRQRSDQSSTLQQSRMDAGRYTDVFEYGYLGILDDAERLRARIPDWLQHFLCYELIGYLTVYERGHSATIESGPIAEAFHRNLARVMARFDATRTVADLEFPASPGIRLAISRGYRDENWVDDEIIVDEFDPDQKLARVRYFFTGDLPAELVINDEEVRGPRHAKTRHLNYYGRTLLKERILWVRYRPDVQLSINGVRRQLSFERPRQHSRLLPTQVRRLTGSPSRLEQQVVGTLAPEPQTALGRKAKIEAAKPRNVSKYAKAWVMIDRVHNATDSAEVLFRHVRANHPKINAWFVIEKGTPDWIRLRKEFGRRVVAHGTLEWRVLMAHCTELLSSHADNPIVKPAEIAEFMRPEWRFTFLQHGVIKDDLSAWLNSKKIGIFVTSTTGEQASIAGDGNRYPFTTKEAKLTGLPRFDRLREVGARFTGDQRDLILVTPTWREWLVEHLAAGTQRRVLAGGALESEFVQSWLAVLRSPELENLCASTGLKIGFLPHPNMQALLPEIELPAHVVPLGYEGVDVQEYFARARVLVTDYSSIAFNAAYLDRPVVYYQFDAEMVRNGGHVGRPGYFSYERDGFGPVLEEHDQVIAAIRDAVEHGPEPTPEYAARVAHAFPQRDGRCSERVVAAVLAASQRDSAPEPEPTPVPDER